MFIRLSHTEVKEAIAKWVMEKRPELDVKPIDVTIVITRNPEDNYEAEFDGAKVEF